MFNILFINSFLHSISVEMWYFFIICINRKGLFVMEIFCNITSLFTFNAFLLNASIIRTF